jgi:hypothetical protein
MIVGIGAQELLLILLVLAVAVAVGKAIASRLGEDQRKIVGGIALFIGALIVVSAISSISSARSQIEGGVLVTIGFGIIVGIAGFVVLASKGPAKSANHSYATKKCPFCAEIIRAEAKFCRFCGKAMETSTENQKDS